MSYENDEYLTRSLASHRPFFCYESEVKRVGVFLVLFQFG